jgi:hypothetical protein
LQASAAQVNARDPVEVFRRDVEHVAADLGGHTGVLDEGVEGALMGIDRAEERGDRGHV